MFGRQFKATKKRCWANAAVALLLAAFMIYCALSTGENQESFYIGAAIMGGMAGWWIYRSFRVGDEDLDDPFHFNH